MPKLKLDKRPPVQPPTVKLALDPVADRVDLYSNVDNQELVMGILAGGLAITLANSTLPDTEARTKCLSIIDKIMSETIVLIDQKRGEDG